MLELKNKVSGTFKIEKVNKEGKILETYNFNNLVVNSGFRMLAQYFTYERLLRECKVGTGNSPPSVEQTTLDNAVASQTVQSSSKPLIPGVTVTRRYIFKFPAGAVPGTISEIGCFNQEAMFNRQLIKDNAGNPTAITVLPQEGLNVTFDIKHYCHQHVWLDGGLFTLDGSEYMLRYYVHDLNNFNNEFTKAQKPTGGSISFGGITTDNAHPIIITYTGGTGTERTFSESNPIAVKHYRNPLMFSLAFSPALTKPYTHTLTLKVLLKWEQYNENL